ncbi:hypothetical protein SELMODRAFT_439773 [Selaginella moellendorffii]|uniref:DUF7794 domain-containing protein n=1 Tax=Selaginella moellendorffii TaxID=88036 RepID=D8R761_SELML|nr:uncharacterized protein LOC9631688 [Selaginella moellendorffii]EFJ31466.1 hypothetical protein SELMODRAFT_439773 [Selaginella moellendorffii]|eukprot:XP_002966867.1 uncharacterized protein LOC9631688 [Selaginella moellendorffii]
MGALELLPWIALLASLILAGSASAEDGGSVFFVETGQGKDYLQSGSQESVFSEADVAASVAVLLGVDPPVTMSEVSASKLERLLIPNVFHRPQRVVSLVIEGFDSGFLQEKNVSQALGVKLAEHRGLSVKPKRAATKHLAGKPVRLESLNHPVPENFDFFHLKRELQGLFGPSSIEVSTEDNVEEEAAEENAAEQELVILSVDGISLELDLFKRSDYLFVTDLLSLSTGVKRAISVHEELTTKPDTAELFFGTFTGIKALKRERQDEDVSKASDIVLIAVAKLFQKLDTLTKGKLVGVVAFPGQNGHHLVREMIGKHYHSYRSRLLEQEKKPQTVEQLSRRTLAASTTIILLIATLLGTCCLCYMPLTRDSLLYSGAKLD